MRKKALWMAGLTAALIVALGGITEAAAAEEGAGLHYRWNSDGTALYVERCSLGSAVEMVIPASKEGFPVKGIDSRAFSGCRNLEKVVIPESVTEIGASAFKDCEKLKSVNLPAGVTRIENETFSHCTSLERVEIPSGVAEIGDSAFAGCTSLTGIELPAGVTVIGGSTFSDCTSLTRVEIPAGVTEIGAEAFRGCESLTPPYPLIPRPARWRPSIETAG